MCGAAVLAPIAAVASLFGGSGKSSGVQSYTPQQQELYVSNPEPETLEPVFGVDNSDTATAAARRGRSALRIDRNPGVGVSGSGMSGVSVPRG